MASLLIFGCGNETNVFHEEGKIEINTVTEFLRDISSLEKDTNVNPINAFKNLANDLVDKKIVLTKDNINEVLNDCKNFSSCIVVVENHTIVKINTLEDCQQSGSWKACMPICSGYIKKGELNYKEDYMNNIIGIPDGQERIAYFFLENKKQPKQRADSYKKAPYSSYYKNGNIKVKGQGFEDHNRYIVSAKNGLNLMKDAHLESKKIVNIPNGSEVRVDSFKGKWLYINTLCYDVQGEKAPAWDEYEEYPFFEGYVLDGFLKKMDSIKKSGVWIYYYESGVIKEEEHHFSGKLIKKITYDTDGDITLIKELKGRMNYGWFDLDEMKPYSGTRVISNEFYKNGNIKLVTDADGFAANVLEFDENGNSKNGYILKNLDELILSKDIKVLNLYDNEFLNKEIKKLNDDNFELNDSVNTTDTNKLSFIEKFTGTSWTNGTDTIVFKSLKGEISNWSDVVGPEMWYLYSVDGPFFVLPCEECYTANECHMCGYNAIRIEDDSLELFWDYQNDFFPEREGVRFYSNKQNIISCVISRGGYFGDYESEEINWFPLDADFSLKTQEINDNKKALEDFLNKKEIEREETEKELFDY